jgi:hypothetical protein
VVVAVATPEQQQAATTEQQQAAMAVTRRQLQAQMAGWQGSGDRASGMRRHWLR